MCLPGSNHGTLRGLFCDEGRGAAVDVRSMCIERERPVRTHRAQGPRVKGGQQRGSCRVGSRNVEVEKRRRRGAWGPSAV